MKPRNNKEYNLGPFNCKCLLRMSLEWDCKITGLKQQQKEQ